MRFRGRELIFYLLLGTLIVPVQLTYIPSFVLAVNVFHYDDSLPALILPSIASAFNIFLMRQAFRSVPDELIDAARIDGATELQIWWRVLMPDRAAVAGGGGHLHLRRQLERLPVAVVDAAHPREHDPPGRTGRAPGLLQLGLPLHRRRRDDDGRRRS